MTPATPPVTGVNMRFASLLAVILFAYAPIGASYASSGVSRPAWTLGQANVRAATAIVPYCQVDTASQLCVNGVSIGKFSPHAAVCKGTARSVLPGRFWRFSCELYAVNQVHVGTIEMTVTGAATFHWKFTKPTTS